MAKYKNPLHQSLYELFRDQRNPGARQAYQKQYNINRRDEQLLNTDPEDRIKYTFRKYRSGAVQRKIKFNITPENVLVTLILQSGKCALTGAELSYNLHNDMVMSIDRIDSDGDYTPDNIQIVTKMANIAKNQFSMDQFVTMCKLVAAKF